MNPGKWISGRDLAPLAIAAMAFVFNLVFVIVSLSYNNGNFIPPLDDTYIHLQYASQIAQGNFFQYETGAHPSSGASSILYVLILSVFYVIGLQGNLFLPAAMAFGIACNVATAVCIFHIGRKIVSRKAGIISGVLVAANGAWLWGSVSGMEVSFVALLVSCTLLAYIAERPSGRLVWTPLCTAAASLTRPEAFVFTIGLSIAMGWIVLRNLRAEKASAWRIGLELLFVALPFVAYGARSLLYLVLTGSTSANGLQAKSFLYDPIVYVTEITSSVIENLQSFFLTFNGLDTFDYAFPGMLILAIWGIVHLAREKPEWRLLSLSIGAGLLGAILAISTLSTAQLHSFRYVLPFVPVLLLLATIGGRALITLISDRSARRRLATLVVTVAATFSAVQLPAWAVRLGQQAAGIRDQQVTIGNWINGHLPKGSVVAVNDVGAPAYFGDYRVLDLIGLTTNELTVPNRHGAGSLYEALRKLPEALRPDYFAVFDNWSVHDLKPALFQAEPLITFELKSPRHARNYVGSTCQATGGCPHVMIESDWRKVGSGDEPAKSQPPGQIRDYINVGDLNDEKEHEYRVNPAHDGFQPMTSIGFGPPPHTAIVDSGRHIIGGETFEIDNVTPGKPVTITSRVATDQPLPSSYTGSREVQVSVNGHEVGKWKLEDPDVGWNESTFTIPAKFIDAGNLKINFGPVQEFLGPYPDYTSYGYWFSQP